MNSTTTNSKNILKSIPIITRIKNGIAGSKRKDVGNIKIFVTIRSKNIGTKYTNEKLLPPSKNAVTNDPARTRRNASFWNIEKNKLINPLIVNGSFPIELKIVSNAIG